MFVGQEKYPNLFNRVNMNCNWTNTNHLLAKKVGHYMITQIEVMVGDHNTGRGYQCRLPYLSGPINQNNTYSEKLTWDEIVDIDNPNPEGAWLTSPKWIHIDNGYTTSCRFSSICDSKYFMSELNMVRLHIWSWFIHPSCSPMYSTVSLSVIRSKSWNTWPISVTGLDLGYGSIFTGCAEIDRVSK